MLDCESCGYLNPIKMKSIIICCVLAVASAGPYYNNPYQKPSYEPQQQYYQPPQVYNNRANVAIVSENNELNLDGSFRYGYATADGQQVQVEGYQKGPDSETINGEYSYTAPNGERIVTKYIADENGFRAEGPHIPTPPPIPDAILRSLAYNAAHPDKYDNQGQYYESQPQPNYRPLQQYRPFKSYK